MSRSYRGKEMLNDTRQQYSIDGTSKPRRNEHKEAMHTYSGEFIDFLIDQGFTKPEIDLYSRELMAGFGSVVGSVLKNGHHDSVIPRNARDCFTYALSGVGFPHCKVAVGQFDAFIKKVAEGRMTIPRIAQPGTPIVTRRVLAGIDENQPVTLVEKPIVQETDNNQMRPPVEMSEITQAIAAAETIAVRTAMDETNQLQITEEETIMTTPNENNTPAQSTEEVTANVEQPQAAETAAVESKPAAEAKTEQPSADDLAKQRLQTYIEDQRIRSFNNGMLAGIGLTIASFAVGTGIGMAMRKFRGQ